MGSWYCSTNVVHVNAINLTATYITIPIISTIANIKAKMMVDIVVALLVLLMIFEKGALVTVTAALVTVTAGLGTHDTPATLASEANTSLRPYSVLEHCWRLASSP